MFASSSCTGSGPPLSPSVAASPYWARHLSSKDETDTTKNASSSNGFSPFVAFCFTINMMIDIVKDHILETMARAEAMLDHRMHWIKKCKTSTTKTTKTGGNDTTATNHGKIIIGKDEEQRLLLLGVNDYSPSIHTTTIEDEKQVQQRQQPLNFVNESGEKHYYGATTTTTITTTSLNPGTAESLPATPLLTGRPVIPPYSRPGGALLPNSPARLYSYNKPTTITKHRKQQLHDNIYFVKDRKFEINTLCRVFLGKTGLHLYTFFAALYLYGVTWAYTSVFASAMASAAPTFAHKVMFYIFRGKDDNGAYQNEYADNDYYAFYTILYGCIVVPLTCMELNEQVTLQVLLSSCRFLIIALMVVTSSYCSAVTATDTTATNNIMMENKQGGEEGISLISSLSSVPMFRPSGLHKTIPILVMAAVFHHSLPNLSHPVVNKKKLGLIFRSTCIFCAIAYSLIGFVLGWTFGDYIEQSANLNWQAIVDACRSSNATDDNSIFVSSCWWEETISLFIICFPALDVVSGFPLNSITLGNSLMGAFYGNEIHEAEKIRWKRIPFRLLGSIPPIICGLMVRELGVITDYTGTVGFIITFTFPALLYLQSKRIAQQKHFSTSTAYTHSAIYGLTHHSNIIAHCLVWFGIIMLLYVTLVMATTTT